jgi:SAM-dependent methyltransferase
MSAAVLMHLLRERLCWHQQNRVPEPDLVMQDHAQTQAFSEAGETGGALAFLYLYNAIQISSLLQPGDRVLDLACGPAQQLLQVAQLNPQVNFVGLDASPTMLECAQHALAQAHIHNVELVQGDMTHLDHHNDASLDAVICTMSLHHLPGPSALATTLREIRRVLKPQGRVYMVDFGRLKLRRSQHFFANDLRQSKQFTEDYFNSLRAAFSVQEMTSAVAVLGPNVQRHVTALAPFLMVFRSAYQKPLDSATLQRVRAALAKLSPTQQANLRGLCHWFRLSGYPLACELG